MIHLYLDTHYIYIMAPTEETVEMAEMANCKPELTTVALDLPEEPNAIFFPTCVRIEQCGGCCYGPLLTCRPTITKVVRLKVRHAQGRGRGGGGGMSEVRRVCVFHLILEDCDVESRSN